MFSITISLRNINLNLKLILAILLAMTQPIFFNLDAFKTQNHLISKCFFMRQRLIVLPTYQIFFTFYLNPWIPLFFITKGMRLALTKLDGQDKQPSNFLTYKNLFTKFLSIFIKPILTNRSQVLMDIFSLLFLPL